MQEQTSLQMKRSSRKTEENQIQNPLILLCVSGMNKPGAVVRIAETLFHFHFSLSSYFIRRRCNQNSHLSHWYWSDALWSGWEWIKIRSTAAYMHQGFQPPHSAPHCRQPRRRRRHRMRIPTNDMPQRRQSETASTRTRIKFIFNGIKRGNSFRLFTFLIIINALDAYGRSWCVCIHSKRLLFA